MIKRSFALLGALFGVIALSACGRAIEGTEAEHQVPEVLEVGEFEPYVARFEEAAGDVGVDLHVTNLIVRFGEMEHPSQRALCRFRSGETPVITVDERGWETMDEAEREALMLHEMGHCVLRRKHKGGTMERGVPSSLMNPYTLDGRTYEHFSRHYHRELFAVQNEY